MGQAGWKWWKSKNPLKQKVVGYRHKKYVLEEWILSVLCSYILFWGFWVKPVEKTFRNLEFLIRAEMDGKRQQPLQFMAVGRSENPGGRASSNPGSFEREGFPVKIWVWKIAPLTPPGSDRPPVSPATYPPRLGSFLIQIRVHFKNQPAVEWLYFLLMILIGFISCSDELCYDCDTIAALSRGETEEIAPLILHWSSIGFWNWVIHNTSMKNIRGST